MTTTGSLPDDQNDGPEPLRICGEPHPDHPGQHCTLPPRHRHHVHQTARGAQWPATTDELSALRDRIAEALTAEHYRRADERIVASPEEHQAACADVVVDVIRPVLERAEQAEAAVERVRAYAARAREWGCCGATDWTAIADQLDNLLAPAPDATA